MDPESQNFDKMKSTPEDIIILRMCTINESHMMYGSGVQRTELLVIFNHFLPFYPPKNLANQNFETMKKKKPGHVIILHMCTIKMTII